MIKTWLMSFLSQVTTIATISLLVIISAFPIVTFFPTLVALMGCLYYFDKRREWPSKIEAFGYFFKQTFFKSLICQLLLMGIVLVGLFNLSLVESMGSRIRGFISVLSFLFIGLMIVMIVNVLFSLVIHPDYNLRAHFRYSLLLVFIKLPQTFLLLAMGGLASLLIFLIPELLIVVVGIVFYGYFVLEKSIWRELLAINSVE